MNVQMVRQEAQSRGIDLSENLLCGEPIRGIYGFFKQKAGVKKCFYIGRSYDIAARIFQHIIDTEKLVFELIEKYQAHGYQISAEILEVVQYEGDNYYRDMQRLAFSEYNLIEQYQRKGECLHQLPEGSWISEANWEKRYKQKG